MIDTDEKFGYNARSMKRRLRKKLHKGEFKEWAFRLDFNLKIEDDSPEMEQFIDDFILNGVVAHGMLCNGAIGKESHQIIEAQDARTTGAEHIAAIKAWMESHPMVESFTVGELKDAWYDSFYP